MDVQMLCKSQCAMYLYSSVAISHNRLQTIQPSEMNPGDGTRVGSRKEGGQGEQTKDDTRVGDPEGARYGVLTFEAEVGVSFLTHTPAHRLTVRNAAHGSTPPARNSEAFQS